jgi:hypothetical protein
MDEADTIGLRAPDHDTGVAIVAAAISGL